MSTQLTPQFYKEAKDAVESGGLPGLRNALMPRSFGEVMALSEQLANSSFVNKDFRGKPGEILAAIAYGAELGLSPMQALQSIAVINGKPAIYGDGLLAVCQNHPQWAGKDEYFEGDTAHCIVRRKGEPDVHATFSVADAKAAGLLGKMGPWTQYRARMQQMRARGFALRDQYADALKGLISEAEARDYPSVGPSRARDVTPPPPIEDPAETSTAIEVVTVYGETVSLMPMELKQWIDEQAAEPVDLTTLMEWAETNDQVPGVIDAYKRVKAACAKHDEKPEQRARPDGNAATFDVRDAAGHSAGTYADLVAAAEGLRLVVKNLPEEDQGPTVRANRGLLEQAMECESPTLRRWAAQQVDWLMAGE